MTTVPLSRGLTAMIDDIDAPRDLAHHRSLPRLTIRDPATGHHDTLPVLRQGRDRDIMCAECRI